MDKKTKVIVISSVILLCLIAGIIGIIYAVSSSSEKEMFNTTEVRVVEATVLAKEMGDDGPYLQVDAPGNPNSPYYIICTQEFYNTSYTGQKVGLIIGNVDKYKVKPSRDKLQLSISYISSAWEALSLFPSLAQAQNENKAVSFTTKATLKQRVKSLDGKYFFLLDAGGKKLMAEVSKDYYNRFTPATTPVDHFELQFDGYGDFNHLTAIINPK